MPWATITTPLIPESVHPPWKELPRVLIRRALPKLIPFRNPRTALLPRLEKLLSLCRSRGVEILPPPVVYAVPSSLSSLKFVMSAWVSLVSFYVVYGNFGRIRRGDARRRGDWGRYRFVRTVSGVFSTPPLE